MDIVSILIGFLVGVIFTIVFYPKKTDELLLQRINDLNEEIGWWIKLWKGEASNAIEMVELLEAQGVNVKMYKHKIIELENGSKVIDLWEFEDGSRIDEGEK